MQQIKTLINSYLLGILSNMLSILYIIFHKSMKTPTLKFLLLLFFFQLTIRYWYNFYKYLVILDIRCFFLISTIFPYCWNIFLILQFREPDLINIFFRQENFFYGNFSVIDHEILKTHYDALFKIVLKSDALICKYSDDDKGKPQFWLNMASSNFPIIFNIDKLKEEEDDSYYKIYSETDVKFLINKLYGIFFELEITKKDSYFWKIQIYSNELDYLKLESFKRYFVDERRLYDIHNNEGITLSDLKNLLKANETVILYSSTIQNPYSIFELEKMNTNILWQVEKNRLTPEYLVPLFFVVLIIGCFFSSSKS